MTLRFNRLAYALLGIAMCSMGCESRAPGARGDITLADEFDPTGWAHLHVVAFPDPGHEDLDLSTVPDSPELESTQHALVDIEFPYAYTVGGGIGVTAEPQWRVVAWLSAEQDDRWISTGEPYGSVAIEYPDGRDCHLGPGEGYCDFVTADIEISTLAP